MSEETIVRLCAPTLAGLKTGSLFTCPYETKAALLEEVRRLNRMLYAKGLRLVPLGYKKGRALLYLFRPSMLRQDLSDSDAAELLSQAGYRDTCVGRCLSRLVRRLQENEDFPHEIGLFLSYPPEDVRGFIENHAQNFKCVGCWKVYGDEQRARSLFRAYKVCTEVYCRLWDRGAALEKLAVAL